MLRILFALAACAMLSPAANVTGKWNVTAQTPSGREYKLELVLKEDAGKLSGSMSTPEGSIDLQDVQLSGDRLSYKLPVGDNVYEIRLTVAEGRMTGNYTSPEGTTGPVNATRPAADSGIFGKWKVHTKSSTGAEYDLDLEVKNDNGTVTGALSTPDGMSFPFQEAKVANGELSCKLDVDGAIYNVKLAAEGAQVKGSFTGPAGETGAITGVR